MSGELSEYNFIPAKFHSSRRGRSIDLVVMHYTAGHGDEMGLAEFFASGKRRASAHFGVGRAGGVVQMVNTDRSAWHTGTSTFMGEGHVGRRSIGIEVCNRGWASVREPEHVGEGKHRNPRSKKVKWEKYPDAQIEAIVKLLAKLRDTIPTLRYITGHEDIRNSWTVTGLKGAKLDPGPLFPWSELELSGLGFEQVHYSFRDHAWYTVTDAAVQLH